MTYRELANIISTMTEEQKDMDVTFYDHNDGEFSGFAHLDYTGEDWEELDPGHPYLHTFTGVIV